MNAFDLMRLSGGGEGGVKSIVITSASPVIPDIEGIYHFFRSINGKNKYKNIITPLYDEWSITWDNSRWEIKKNNILTVVYYSDDDVATPDLCTTWHKNSAVFCKASGSGNSELNGLWLGHNDSYYHDLGFTYPRLLKDGAHWELNGTNDEYWMGLDGNNPSDVSWTTKLAGGIDPAPTFTTSQTGGDITVTEAS